MRKILLAMALSITHGCATTPATGTRFTIVDEVSTRAIMNDKQPVLLRLPAGCVIVVEAEKDKAERMAYNANTISE